MWSADRTTPAAGNRVTSLDISNRSREVRRNGTWPWERRRLDPGNHRSFRGPGSFGGRSACDTTASWISRAASESVRPTPSAGLLATLLDELLEALEVLLGASLDGTSGDAGLLHGALGLEVQLEIDSGTARVDRREAHLARVRGTLG